MDPGPLACGLVVRGDGVGIVGGVVGILGGVITGVVRAPFTKGKSLGRDSLYGAAIVGCPLSEATGAVIGSPFYVLEKSLWDFPKWLFTSKDSTEGIEEKQKYNNGINTDAQRRGLCQ